MPRAKGPEPRAGAAGRQPRGQRLAALRRALLDAREARQAHIGGACSDGRSVIAVGVNVPGPDKHPPGARCLVRMGGEALVTRLAAEPLLEGDDALGPWAVFRTDLPPATAKRLSVAIESSLPAGRVLDLDVYTSAVGQVDRAAVGLPARTCLLCALPAVECMRAGRHDAAEVHAAASRLLLRVLASALVRGARAELDLTPKPGLVDRLDSGSHPDLSFDDMARSIDLLPTYFDELLDLGDAPDLDSAVAAGRRAERRMIDAIGSNAHKGYIFLAGLLLLAARGAGDAGSLQSNVSALARRVLGQRRARAPLDVAPSHGDRARAEHGVDGILGEASRGLPSVFERGLPVLHRAGLKACSTGDGVAAGHLLMAVLMQSVDDTTALHRCGPDGLARLRKDGRELQRRIEAGQDCTTWLGALNEEYRRANLTMGGVADCMALSFALHEWLGL